MNNEKKISAWYSWPSIILFMIFFWPIGVFLLIKRVSIDKTMAMGADKIVGKVAIALYCFAGLGVIACLGEGFLPEDIAFILFFAVAGFVLQKLSNKLKNESDEVKKYLSMIVNGNERQLDVIASSVGKTYDEAKSDIQKLISKGYLKNAYINEGLREVVLPNNETQVQNQGNTISKANNIGTRVIVCSCCGANNTVSGPIGECEYCGTPLK